MAEPLSESLTRAVDAGVKALRDGAYADAHELESKPDTAPSVREIVLQSIEERRQHADVLEGYLQRFGRPPQR